MNKKVKKYAAKGSNRTTPISLEQFNYILAEFADRSDIRMEVVCHLMFRCCRIGDILKTIRKKDIYSTTGEIREKLVYIEEKTNKKRILSLKGEMLLSALSKYHNEIDTLPMDSVLFYTKKSGTELQDSGVKKLLREFIGNRGITQCSPHSFRKGGSRHMFESGVRIEFIRDVLNHHSSRTTETYIDITPVDIDQSMQCLEI